MTTICFFFSFLFTVGLNYLVIHVSLSRELLSKRGGTYVVQSKQCTLPGTSPINEVGGELGHGHIPHPTIHPPLVRLSERESSI